MADRITPARLERAILEVNTLLGMPTEPYTATGEPGTKSYCITANPGCFYLAGAFGGSTLERMSGGGGSQTPLMGGYTTKRLLYNEIQALLVGIKLGKSCTI